MDAMENAERSRFDSDAYPRLGAGFLGTLGAEEAICLALLQENDSLSAEQAKRLAADFIRNGRSLRIIANVNGLECHYVGGDPVLGRRPFYLCCA